MATVKKPIKKAQAGIKATKDSTAYFSNVKNNAYKVADDYRNAAFSGGDVREKAKKVAFKASDDLVRQSKKGKPGYDANGFPKKKNGGSVKAKDGKWIQKAINPAHKGYCTPETKATCTPKRKALAHTLRKMAAKRKSK